MGVISKEKVPNGGWRAPTISKPMRSHEERRQQNILQGSSRQRNTVKPEGYAGAPSSSSAQFELSSREGQCDLLEKMLEGDNLR